MEPVRPVVDRIVFDFIRSHTFSDGECWETRDGHCRLDPALVVQIAPWIGQLRAAVSPLARDMAKEFSA
jgi:hypothetical protein